jgi:DNA repair exonuclease SbcCD ATPase subunit
VRQHLANLKASGDYARIIREVTEQVEREQKDAFERLERAEKERQAAEAREREAEERRKKAAAEAKAAREEADRKRTELARQKAEAEAELAEKRRREAEAELKKFEALKQTRDTVRRAAEKNVEDTEKITFDFEGVARHMTNAHHIDVFREAVTGKGLRDYLPVNRQAALAKELVRLARERDRELTGGFIRENIMGLVLHAKVTERQWSREDKEAQHDFVRGCDLMQANGLKLRKLIDTRPRDVTIPISREFRTAIEDALKNLTTLNRRI